ncbi:GNAT family N-acetyltransferase [Anthocerotibacter panamensis]|uniref:GNAT family N-acetyltransferase n=1 Tax=Anthocerotibacter panamensis TaxID=2857077 RepID=UPI001C4044D4|nr:GNAT family N-acetyltransferase [Anthocerotibacter panamensis]
MLTFRSATPEDEGFLGKLYASTRAEEMAALPALQQELFLKLQFTAQSQFYAAQFPHGNHQIVFVKELLAGRIFVNRNAQEVRLVDIALLPKFRGKGIGTSLLNGLLTEAKQSGKPVRLQVMRLNRAQGLYERMGFVQTGNTDTHLQMEWRPQHLDTMEG